MKHNSLIVASITMVLIIGLFTSCNDNTVEFEDGLYFAIEDEFANTGWKGFVIVDVTDGIITDVTWSAVSIKGGLDKIAASKAGFYPMVASGGAQSEWYEQSQLVSDYVLDKQSVESVKYKDDKGHTDAIAGVSIHVDDFYALLNSALETGPQEVGPYTDGAYSAEEAEFSRGWKGTVDITVIFGKILAVNWNAINEEDPELDKKTASVDGDYVLGDGNQAPWHEQAISTEAHLIATQDPTDISYTDDDGHTDAIAGVSIHVDDFYALVNEALKSAK